MQEDLGPEAGGPRARFSPLKMVARALGASQGPPPAAAAPIVRPPARPAEVDLPTFAPQTISPPSAPEDSFLAIVNAMLEGDEDGALTAGDATFDLMALIGEAHDAFASAAASQGVTLALAVGPDAAGVYRGDVLRVRQALLNLVSGAMKATSGDLLELTVERADGGLTFQVAADGAAAAMKPVLATPSRPGRRRGAAARMAQALASTAALGGTIEVSQDGAVQLNLPLHRIERALARAPAAAATEVDPPTLRFDPGLRVLVAEASPPHQQMLATLLGGMGLEAVVVGDGQAVVQAWREERWDVLLIDIEDETMCGRSVAASIRAAEAKARWPRMPMLALVAHLRATDLDEEFAVVVDGLVAKPIHAPTLRQALAAFLDAEPVTSETRVRAA